MGYERNDRYSGNDRGYGADRSRGYGYQDQGRDDNRGRGYGEYGPARDYREDRADQDRRPRGYDNQDRGLIDRAGDEVRSWFGDEDAERRRRADERNDHRGAELWRGCVGERAQRRSRPASRSPLSFVARSPDELARPGL